MIRSSVLIGAALSILSSAGCNTAADDQAKADKAQAAATDKTTSAMVEANQKIASAQAVADKKIAEAQGNFMKLREDYRHSVTTDLADLDQRVAKLTAKEQLMSGQGRADFDARLAKIRAEREAFDTDYRKLEAASALTWDDTKARLDKEMSALKTLVDGS
jgi:glucose/arabinose dehydrogenase